MKKILSLLISFLLLFATSVTVFADNTINNYEFTPNDFDGEQILYSYIENGELYVVTSNNSYSYASSNSGKCPTKQKIVNKTVSRKTLQQWRDDNELEYQLKSNLASAIFGALSYGVGVGYSFLAVFIPHLSQQCQSILDNTTKSNINIKCVFSCTQKIQSGSWGHVWKLVSVEAA